MVMIGRGLVIIQHMKATYLESRSFGRYGMANKKLREYETSRGLYV